MRSASVTSVVLSPLSDAVHEDLIVISVLVISSGRQ